MANNSAAPAATPAMIATGVSGWMADFGEALPFDAELFEGTDAAEFHNRYPEEWARVNREAVQEAELDDEISKVSGSTDPYVPVVSADRFADRSFCRSMC